MDASYVYKKSNTWIKMTNYIDDALYFSNDSGLRDEFESLLKKRFSLSLLLNKQNGTLV